MITPIKSSFLEYKMTILRNKKTPNSLFRQTMNEISYLIAAEVLNLSVKLLPLIEHNALCVFKKWVFLSLLIISCDGIQFLDILVCKFVILSIFYYDEY